VRQWVGKNEAGQSVYDEFEAPAPVMKYRTYMGGVDRFDQVVQYYQQPFRNRRWPLAFFFWSFNVAISHGLTLYQCLANPDAALKEYSVELAYQLRVLAAAGAPSPRFSLRSPPDEIRIQPKRQRFTVKGCSELRFQEPGHYPVSCPQTTCVVCTMMGDRPVVAPRSRSKCVKCGVGLCAPKVSADGDLEGCHVMFHDMVEWQKLVEKKKK
jgi:hypothetical protein